MSTFIQRVIARRNDEAT